MTARHARPGASRVDRPPRVAGPVEHARVGEDDERFAAHRPRTYRRRARAARRAGAGHAILSGVTGPLPVLVVAHQSPPLGGPGVRRVASWMRCWPGQGVEPLLLTAPAEDGARFHHYAVLADSDGEFAGRVVLRIATPPAPGLGGLLLRMGFPRRVPWTLCHARMREPETSWADVATAAGVELARRSGARVVVSTSQPYVDHAVGRAVARALALPWVADFRDPMTEAEGRSWPTRLHRWAERRLERRWLADADLVWASCESAAARWRERFPTSAAKVVVRRNGVGPVDLLSLPAAPSVPPLRIGHVGRFTDRPAGSRLRFLDVRPGGSARSGSTPAPLFAALASFLASTPAARGHVRWVTVGDSGGEPPAGVVAEAHGVVSNAEALAVAASCHALYLPLTKPPPWGTLLVPQKVYEYAALGRPVLVSGSAPETLGLLGPLALPGGDDAATGLLPHIEALWSGRVPLAARPMPAPRQEDVAAACAADLLALVATRQVASAAR